MRTSATRLGPLLAASLLPAFLGLLPGPVTAGEAPPHPPPPPAGRVGRPFEEPAGRFGRGHRGIDILLPAGSPVRAAADGTVAFAGAVAGARFVTLAHDGPGGAFETTYGYLSRIDVRRGDRLHAGDVIGAAGGGHHGRHPPGLHFGMRRNGRYVDPRPLLAIPSSDVTGLVSLGPLPGPP